MSSSSSMVNNLRYNVMYVLRWRTRKKLRITEYGKIELAGSIEETHKTVLN